MESEYEMYFKEFLRKRRLDMGLTQEKLAQMVHVSKSAVTKWESGRGFPDRVNLRQLSQVLGISMETMNGMYEGNEKCAYELIVNDIIEVLNSHGYDVIKKEEVKNEEDIS